MARDCAHAALAALDAALACRPEKDGPKFSAAMRCLCIWRDEIRAQHRARRADPFTQRELDGVNAAISVTIGAHYPLGEIPWDELEVARALLAALVAESTQQAET